MDGRGPVGTVWSEWVQLLLLLWSPHGRQLALWEEKARGALDGVAGARKQHAA